MAKTPKEYQRLPGRGMRSQGFLAAGREVCTLWQGQDHLLLVTLMGGYTESYKRFYYRDIQAFIIRQTNRRLLANVAFGVLGFLFLLPMLVTSGKSAAFLPLLTVNGLFFGTLILINTLKGPTCSCHVKTAVQTEELPSLKRVNRARKVIERIRPKIDEAQGTMLPEEMTLRWQESLTAPTDQVPQIQPLQQAMPLRSDEPLRQTRGHWHTAMFWLCLLDVPLTLLAYLTKSSPALMVLGQVQFFAVGIVSAIALVKQQGTNLPARLRRLPLAELIALGVFFLASQIYRLVRVNDYTAGPGMFQNLIQAPKDPGGIVLSVVSTLASLMIGGLGLMWLREYHQQSLLPPPVPPMPPPPPSASESAPPPPPPPPPPV